MSGIVTGRAVVHAGGMNGRRLGALALLWLLPAGCAEITQIEREVFEAVNRERIRQRLEPLAWDDETAGAARSHSRRMRDLNFFAHEDPARGNLSARLARASIPWRSAAENIFVEKGFANPAGQAVKSWFRSPGHRRNILGRRWTRTGVGVATDGRGKYWFTQIFVGGGGR